MITPCLVLLTGILAASSQTNETSQIASGLCSFKILVLAILPTIALVFFLLSPIALGLAVIVIFIGYLMHREKNPEVKVDFRKPGSMHIVLRVGVGILVAGILLPVIGVVCIILAVIAPIIVSMMAGGATSAC